MRRHVNRGIMLLVGALLALMPFQLVAAQGPSLSADLFVLLEGGQVMRLEAGARFATAVTSPDQKVIDFGVAPDGAWVAYRTAAPDAGGTGPFLAITSIDGLSGQVLEFEEAGQPPIVGRGQTLAWSPDGTAIAYTTAAGLRVYLAGLGEDGGPAFVNLSGGPFLNLIWSPGGGYLAAEAEADSWWVYRRQVDGMAYIGQIPASAGLAWVREGVLALAPPTGGLITLDVTSGAQTTLVGAETIVSRPAVVDGARLVFLVHEASGQRFAARRFGTVSLTGGDFVPVESSRELTAAMRWLPDGTALTETVDGALTIVEPRTNSRQPIMQGVKAYAWGPPAPAEVAGLTLPADLYFLSRDEAGVAQVWRLPGDGSPATAITREPRSVIDFAVAPDGGQIAYSSSGRLLAAAVDGSAARELSPIGERVGAGGQPAWSPDGRLIAFVRDGIWLIPAAGGARTELITDVFSENTPPPDIRVYMNPRWSPDGTMLLIDVGYYEGRSLALLPITGGEARPLPTAAGRGAWLPDGRVLVWDYGYAYTEPGLYVVNPADLSAYTTILNNTWHIFDARPLASAAAMILRAPGGDVMGPGVAQPFLVPILPDALPIPQGQGGLIEAPLLAPGGSFAAGLRNASYDEFGLSGRLVILNLETGERIAVSTPGNIWNLQWGGVR